MIDKTKLQQRKIELLAELRIINEDLREPDEICIDIAGAFSGVECLWNKDHPDWIYVRGEVITKKCADPERGFSCIAAEFFARIQKFKRQIKKATS